MVHILVYTGYDERSFIQISRVCFIGDISYADWPHGRAAFFLINIIS